MSTSARVAVVATTELTRALAQRWESEALSPLLPDAWEDALHSNNLLAKYPNLVSNIRHGFDVGIPRIQYTITPRNSPSLRQYSDVFLDIVQKELRLGRYLGPYPRSVIEASIGPFQTSPLSVIPKPHRINAFRLIQNFSFPQHATKSHASLNSFINSDDYPCTWGTFNAFSLMLSRLPPGSQAAVRDISEAYRLIPLRRDQLPGAVLRFSDGDEFLVDLCAAFGLSGNAGIFGTVGDALADILRATGIIVGGKWIDDFVLVRTLREFIEAYNQRRQAWRAEISANGGQHQSGGRIWYGGRVLQDDRLEEFDEDMSASVKDLSHESPRSEQDMLFSCSIEDVDRVYRALGVPWQPSKDVAFSSVFPYTGFLWDIKNGTVALLEEKRLKYLAAIADWRKSPTHDLREAQKLYGKLLHVCHLIREGRAYLTEFKRMFPAFTANPFMPRHFPSALLADLHWWTTTLSNPSLRVPIRGEITVVDVPGFSDASTSGGIAVVLGNRWRAWKLAVDWDREAGRDIGFLEAVGFEFLVSAVLASEHSDQHFRVWVDNQGVVSGWANGRSRNRPSNEAFKRIHRALAVRERHAYLSYIASGSNPADGPSRGLLLDQSRLLPIIPIPPALRHIVFDIGDEDFAANSQPLQRVLRQPASKSRTRGQPSSAFSLRSSSVPVSELNSIHSDTLEDPSDLFLDACRRRIL